MYVMSLPSCRAGTFVCHTSGHSYILEDVAGEMAYGESYVRAEHRDGGRAVADFMNDCLADVSYAAAVCGWDHLDAIFSKGTHVGGVSELSGASAETI